MMAGVDVYDPERQNENPWVDDKINNDGDNDTTTTSLQPEVFQESVTDASLRARLNALRDMQDTSARTSTRESKGGRIANTNFGF